VTLENLSLLGNIFILSNVVTLVTRVNVVDEVFMFVCDKKMLHGACTCAENS